MPVITNKLIFLFKLCEIDEEQFISEFTSENPNVRRDRAKSWLDSNTSMQAGNRERLTQYFKKWVGSMEASWWDNDDDVFEKKCLDGQKKQRSIFVDSPIDLQEFSAHEIEALEGDYALWRFAFSNDGDVAKDVMRLEAPNSERVTFLKITMTCIPPKGHFAPQYFDGKLFKMGNVYYAQTTFSGAKDHDVARLRSIYWPLAELKEGLNLRWGVMSGGLQETHEPVAVRVVAEKLNEPIENGEECIARILADEVKTKVEEKIERLIDNDVQRTSVTNRDWMLSVGQKLTTPGWLVDTHERLNALSGTYQLIRPHSTDKGTYILEPFKILPPRDGMSTSETIMFSHNFPTRDYMYSGEVKVTQRYASVFVERNHDKTMDGMKSRRTLILYVDLQQRYRKTFDSRPCISGLMLRGVTGHKGYAGPVAIPFVAIRDYGEHCILEKCITEKLSDDLYRFRKGILAGKIDNSSTSTSKLCKKLFSYLKETGVADTMPVLKAKPPKELQKGLKENASEDQDYFKSWSEAVETDWPSNK